MTSAPLPSVPRVGHHHHESFAAPAALNPIVRRSRRPKMLCSGPVQAPTQFEVSLSGEDQVMAGLFAAGVAGWSTDPDADRRWLPIMKEPRSFAQVLASVLVAGRRW